MRLKLLSLFVAALLPGPAWADGEPFEHQANVSVSLERGVRVWRPIDTGGAGETPTETSVVSQPASADAASPTYAGGGIYAPGYGYGYGYGYRAGDRSGHHGLSRDHQDHGVKVSAIFPHEIHHIGGTTPAPRSTPAPMRPQHVHARMMPGHPMGRPSGLGMGRGRGMARGMGHGHH